MYNLIWEQTMKKLNITKEAFEKSRYFKNKYGKLEYVSESGKVFKTDKGKLLKFKESVDRGEWMDENLFDLIKQLYDVASKARTELKDKKLSSKLREIANELTDLRLDGIENYLKVIPR